MVTAMKRLALVAALTAAGCMPPETEPVERVASTQAAISVEEAVTAGCSTAQVEGLSLQIIAQGSCIEPGAFVELTIAPNVTTGSAVLPFMEEPARDALASAIDQNPSLPMQINSMLRTVAQQYLLYRWYLTGSCGIGLAASPGNSNHETGLAIDIQQYDSWRTILEANDFAWLGPSDPVHFDYVGPGAIDYKGTDVLAFQQLWNLNNPGDIIDEDGLYGPQTEGALQQAPAEGFARGAICSDPPTGSASLVVAARIEDAGDDFSDGPSQGTVDLFEGDVYTLVIDVTNNGDAALAASTLTVALPAAISSDDPLSVDVASLQPDESTQLSLELEAISYSVDQPNPLSVDVSIDDVSDTVAVDIYSQRRWLFDGERREGWTASGDSDAVSVDAGQLVLSTSAGELSARGPVIDVPTESVLGIRLRASRSIDGAAYLQITSDGDTTDVELDLPADGMLYDITVDPTGIEGLGATITQLALVANADAAEPAQASLDELLLDTTDLAGGIPGDNGGCGCMLPRDRRDSGAPWALLVCGLLLIRRSGQRRREPHLRE